MITLRQIAYQALRPESGGDISIDSNLSEAYAIRYARQAANKMLAPKVFERLSQDDRSGLQLMIVTYEVDVLGDIPAQYSNIPEFYINLPFNKGLHGIAPIDDPTNFFIPRNTPSVSRNLPCADLEPDQYSFWTVGLKAFYDNNIDFGKVLMYLAVAAPDSIGVDDPLPIFSEMQYDLILMVRQMLTNQPLQDRVVDNNPSIGVKTAR